MSGLNISGLVMDSKLICNFNSTGLFNMIAYLQYLPIAVKGIDR